MSVSKKILIIEDDSLVAELERDYLEMAGYEVAVCEDGNEGLTEAKKGEYDLLLVDVMLPGVDGFQICREIRKECNLPIIIVTARTDEYDKIRGLGFGADDYVTKPFGPSELVARVNAHIRIHERLLGEAVQEKEEMIETDGLKILCAERRVFADGEEVYLKNMEFELLLFLASNPNMVFSKETLFQKIWGMDAAGDSATVFVHINRIREKIEKNPKEPKYIETVWGAGYRFVKKSEK